MFESIGRGNTVVAEATATSSTTYKQVLEALKTNGGQKLLDAYRDHITTLRLVQPYLVFYPATVFNSDVMTFFCTALGSYTNIYGITIYINGSNHLYRSSRNGAAPTDYTSNTVESAYQGTWKIVY